MRTVQMMDSFDSEPLLTAQTQNVTVRNVTSSRGVQMIRQKSLGALEQQVMEFLWERGPSTGEEVRAAVGKERPLTDSTIRTVLRRLEAKQYVQHDMDGRQFLYSS